MHDDGEHEARHFLPKICRAGENQKEALILADKLALFFK